MNSGIHAIVFDGLVEDELLEIAENTGVKYLVAMGSKVKSSSSVQIMTADDL